MATMKDIKARINTVANIKKITKAMQLVAAAKLTRAQERAHTVRPYADELDGILGAISGSGGSDDSKDDRITLVFGDDGIPISTTRDRFFEQTDVKRPAVVLFTSDRGLCGGFNTNLIRAAQEFLKEHSDKDCKMVTIGKKGHQHFRRQDVDIILHRNEVSDKLILLEIKAITGELVNLYVSGEVDAIYFIYAKSLKASNYKVMTQKFLSIPSVETDTSTSHDYIMEPDRDAMFAQLIPLYATTAVFSALADSFASEYGAKMAAMQQATKNAEEKLDALILLRNRLRQATITRELAEIVGGAEALT